MVVAYGEGFMEELPTQEHDLKIENTNGMFFLF